MHSRGRHSKISTVKRVAQVAAESLTVAEKASILGTAASVAWKTVANAKQADRVIRSKPYQSIGIAFGLGMLLGCMITRRQSY